MFSLYFALCEWIPHFYLLMVMIQSVCWVLELLCLKYCEIRVTDSVVSVAVVVPRRWASGHACMVLCVVKLENLLIVAAPFHGLGVLDRTVRE